MKPNQPPDRQAALALLRQYNRNEALIHHALAVEAVMRYLARKKGLDEELWGIIGLIHDLDYEQFPEEHCHKTKTILEEQGWPEEMIRAAISHGWGLCNDIEPKTDLEKTLYTVDELTGLVAAAALVRPSKSVLDLETPSVKKKWKQKNFAAGVNRQIIEQGVLLLGVSLEELIQDVIMGMRDVAEEIGL
jgi:putative nucleotidyltransferase with HDIG domain